MAANQQHFLTCNGIEFYYFEKRAFITVFNEAGQYYGYYSNVNQFKSMYKRYGESLNLSIKEQDFFKNNA